ncbi:putative membrane protein [Melghirimyces profundicolus]|uniref:Putative membrane protein n=1 Tax=Melghirimyces profundicolus TaxID=1242148 RepID=A0A2T6C7F3_9BACL|nr:EamA family transporter [Melghirimyces profundicolus]PTX64244.1 putative membrane protein [Melghirimyces profundicolus]
MWFVWALISFVTFGMSGFLMKTSSVQKGSMIHTLWGIYLSGTLGFALWTFLTGSFRFDLPVLLGGLAVGLGSAAGNWLFMMALARGPASLTSPLVNTNILLIIAFSVAFYGERLSPTEWTGVTLLILAVFLIPIDPDETLAIRDRIWYGLVTAATIAFTFRNGGLKVTDERGMAGEIVLMYGYLFSLLWMSVELWRKRSSRETAEAVRTGLRWGITAGFFSFIGMQFYAIALIDGPASIVAPVFAANSLVVALLSILFFKERLSRLQTIALILLIAGLILSRI